MLRKRSIILGCVLVFSLIYANAEASEKIKKEEYQKYLKEKNEEYHEFEAERKNEFERFTEGHWKEFKAFREESLWQKPKPDIIPKAPDPVEENGKEVGKESMETNKSDLSLPIEKVNPDKNIKAEKNILKEDTGNVHLSFFNTPMSFEFHESIPRFTASHIDDKKIEEIWSHFSRMDYSALIAQLRKAQKTYHLNDWGYLQLLYHVSNRLLPDDKLTRDLFLWFLLQKSGYESKISYFENGVYLLIPFQETLFGFRFIQEGDVKYYYIPFDSSRSLPKKLYSYTGQSPHGRLLATSIEESPSFAFAEEKKTFRFEYDNESYSIPVTYNKNLIAFLSGYPQTIIPVYGKAPAHIEAVVRSLDKIIQGKSEVEQVNIILAFCQKAFTYKTDHDQFGKEKVMFSEETLFYPYSDCEDRAILFHYLMNRLTHLKTIFIKYPWHLAAAVLFSDSVTGDKIQYQGKTFLICDPTYTNARAGMSMPQLKKEKVEVVDIGAF